MLKNRSLCIFTNIFNPTILTNKLNLKYELRLVASDNLNENYTTIVIHVNDVNDNPPVFDRPTYETQITEEDDRMLPKRVLQVEKSQKHIPHFCFCLFSSLFTFFVLSPSFLAWPQWWSFEDKGQLGVQFCSSVWLDFYLLSQH